MLKSKFKFILSFALIVAVSFACFGFTACGKNKDPKLDYDNNKVLVTYFSAQNHTKAVAEYISEALSSDIKEIEPQTPYTSADLNYNDSNSRVSKEHNDSSIRPEIVENFDNLDEYDIIFIGYPIWWGEAPSIILTFLETYGENLKGKTIVPFCTSSSSGLGKSAEHLHDYVSSATWLSGKRFSSNVSKDDVKEWVEDLSV